MWEKVKKDTKDRWEIFKENFSYRELLKFLFALTVVILFIIFWCTNNFINITVFTSKMYKDAKIINLLSTNINFGHRVLYDLICTLLLCIYYWLLKIYFLGKWKPLHITFLRYLFRNRKLASMFIMFFITMMIFDCVHHFSHYDVKDYWPIYLLIFSPFTTISYLISLNIWKADEDRDEVSLIWDNVISKDDKVNDETNSDEESLEKKNVILGSI